MERRKFVKKLSVLTTGTLVLSSTSINAFENDKTSNSIDFSPLSSDNRIMLKGNFIDSETLEPIKHVKMTAKVKKNRLFSLNESLESGDGSYKIESGFTKNKKSDKVAIQINANGYKPYDSSIYLTSIGSNIHSDEWNYNPNFNFENCPKNEIIGNQIISTYNFYLVRN